MTNASDALIKQEIFDSCPTNLNNFKLRIFPQTSTQDEQLFENGGLTFTHNNTPYGSCDAAFIRDIKKNEIIAIEGTDCLNRKSSGSAQCQRFHHALGAVRRGLIGIYYLRKGNYKVRADLYGMAVNATKYEKGTYLITQDLNQIFYLIKNYNDSKKRQKILELWINDMKESFDDDFKNKYENDYETFANKRSTIIKDNYICHYQGNAYRSFTTSEGRGGHLSLGEIYLSKYLFEDILKNRKKLYFLFPRMSLKDLYDLDRIKHKDKEWFLHRNENNVFIKTFEDLVGLDNDTISKLKWLRDKKIPNGTEARRIYNECIKLIEDKLKNNSIKFT